LRQTPRNVSRLSSFTVGSYRYIGGLALDEIAPFNLVTGRNGAGKSSLLEALWLFHGRASAANLWAPAIQRSLEPVTDPIERLSGDEVRLSGSEDGVEHTLRASFAATLQAASPNRMGNDRQRGSGGERPAPTAGFLRFWLDGRKLEPEGDLAVTTPGGLVQLPGQDANRGKGILVSAISVIGVADDTIKEFGKLVVHGGKSELIEDLRIILPWILDVEVVVAESGSTYVLATTADGARLPLQALGGGGVRLFHALIAMRTANTGAIFLDEVEIGLHHSALPDLWRCIRRLGTALDVQVFASTHSSECLDAAVEAFREDPDQLDDLAVHHLYRGPETRGVRASTYRGETLLGAREINLELR